MGPACNDTEGMEMNFEDYRKQFPATRYFQLYTSEQRANHAASHRLARHQRVASGHYFFVHPHVPARAFAKRSLAERAGFDQYIDSAEAAPDDSGTPAATAPLVHLTHTGPAAGLTLCGAPRNGPAYHAVYAPVEREDYRATCCASCIAVFARAWTGERDKPQWVKDVLGIEKKENTAVNQLSLFA